MVDWLLIWGVAKGAELIFKPILEDLAKDAAKDWAKDILKGIPGKIFEKLKKEDIDIAAGKALKEFLQLMQQQLKVRCKLPEGEIKEYIGDIKKFISDKSVKKTLGQAFDITCEDLSYEVLAESWQKLQLKTLPAKFNWQSLTEQYFTQVQELLLEAKELHSILELQKLSNIEINTKELAGVVADFDLNKYQENIRESYGNLKLDSLDTTGYAYNELKLWRMFIAQNVREVHQVLPQVHELPKEHLKRLRESDQLEAEIAAEELENHKRVYLEQAILSVLDVVNDKQTYKYIVVLGDPGSGKSTLLQYLTLNWAESPLDNVISLPIPLLIELRTYMRRRDDKECQNFLEFFHKCSGAITHLNQHQLHEKLKAGNAVVMFDGLDEVFDPGKREDVITDIHRFTNDYPNVQVIVTSRVIGYKPQRLRDAEFRHFMLQDLNSEQIQEFIHRWHELTFSDEADKVRKRERLQRGIETSKAITELAGNPLLLTMMAILNRNQELPRDRAELYNQASRVLLHQWDVERALVEDERLDNKTIDYKDKQAMLRQVAYSMQTSDKGLAGNLISASQLENILAAYLRTLEINQPRQAARVMINQLRTRNFMLCFLGADYYAFVHRTFLEYFCAWEFVWQFKETQTLSIEVLKEEIFGKHWEDESWHEVLLLIAGMIEAKFVGEVIKYLMMQDGESEKFLNYFLAAKCLAEVRNRQEIEEIADELLNKLKDLTKYDLWYYYEPYKDEEETKLVQEIRTQAVVAIATTWIKSPQTLTWLKDRAIHDNNWDVRYIAVQELARGYKHDSAILGWLKDRAIHDDDYPVRYVAVQELARGYKHDSAILTILKDRAIHDDYPVRRAAVQELARGYKHHPEVLAILKDRAIHDNHSAVRYTAVQELARGYKHDSAILAILKDRTIHDGNSDVRQAAVQELARGYKHELEILSWLKDRAIHDSNWDVRQAAVQELARDYKYDSAILTILKDRAIHDGNSDVRRAAVQELASGYKRDPEILAIFKDCAIHDDNWDVRSAAVQELVRGYKHHPEILAFLKDRAQNDDNLAVRSAAVQELARGYKHEPEILSWLKERAQNDDNWDVRQAAVQELACGYKHDPAILTFLKDRAIHDSNWDVRQAAVQELARGYKHDPATLAILKDRAQNDDNWHIRRVAVQELARGYKHDPAIVSWLKNRTQNDDNWDVRQAAVQALSKYFKNQPELFDIYYNCAVNDPFKREYSFENNPRQTALEIIVKQFPRHPQTLPLLRDRAENDPDDKVREYAQKQLKRWEG
ncbi:HEAT repeat domain-containing protein [Nostoc sp. FACHB-110]|uniref:HEAT repeat domain-containing protein n=1 Tax=Nostoc sp. FACHB-110 TaxID=2692834 RepID=UPI0016820AF8|nr:HEAT repeat domain-containing protein [Nostoc sp. FACHB-110]MBD2438735.1 HEAT repeat domain-containing protein [Nostoc sp. FACHB-110]